MRLIDLIEDSPIIELSDGKTVLFIAGARIDCDGSGGNPDRDPYFQADTTLHHNGKALDAYKVPFIAVPPQICKRTKGIVLGSWVNVYNFTKNLSTVAVVADIGPLTKIGEISPACASAIGLNPNPNHGGTGLQIIVYEILVGTPAMIEGVSFALQSFGSRA